MRVKITKEKLLEIYRHAFSVSPNIYDFIEFEAEPVNEPTCGIKNCATTEHQPKPVEEPKKIDSQEYICYPKKHGIPMQNMQKDKE